MAAGSDLQVSEIYKDRCETRAWWHLAELQRCLQVYACLAEELPKEACHAVLIQLLEDISKDATEDVTWAIAEAISAIQTAMTMEQKAGGSERLDSSLLRALQR